MLERAARPELPPCQRPASRRRAPHRVSAAKLAPDLVRPESRLSARDCWPLRRYAQPPDYFSRHRICCKLLARARRLILERKERSWAIVDLTYELPLTCLQEVCKKLLR